MYIYIYIYILYVYIYIYIHIYTFIHTHVIMYTYVYIYILYTYTHRCVYIYIYMCICICVTSGVSMVLELNTAYYSCSLAFSFFKVARLAWMFLLRSHVHNFREYSWKYRNELMILVVFPNKMSLLSFLYEVIY